VEGSQRRLELAVDGEVAGHQPRGPRPAAGVEGRLGRRGANPRIAGQAEVVVGAEVDEPLAPHLDHRPLRAGERLEGAAQPLGVQVGQRLVDPVEGGAGHRRRRGAGQRTTGSGLLRVVVAFSFQWMSCSAWPVKPQRPVPGGRSESPCASTMPMTSSGVPPALVR